MEKTKFECHITLNRPKDITEAKQIFSIVAKTKMKTSWITGDPVLGVGKWFYISGYNESYDALFANMKEVVEKLKELNVEIVREKIEQILYDTKTNYFTCGVDCFACLE